MSTTVTNPSISILPAALQASTSYTISLEVKVWSALGNFSGFSAMTFTTGSVPVPGSCSSDPVSGILFNTTFSLTCVDWNDEADAYPLQYTFQRRFGGVYLPLVPFSYSSVVTDVVLPAPEPGTNNTVYLQGVVKNVYGAYLAFPFAAQVWRTWLAFLLLCVCVCVYVLVCVCSCVCMCVCSCVCICVCARVVCVCALVCVYVCLLVCVCVLV